jgi:transcriptional regulator with XRE-family HTH domain
MVTSSLGDRIREERERAGLTQAQLAKLVGVSGRTIGNWERGEADPRNSLTRLRDILPALREPVADIHWPQAPVAINPTLAAIEADPYLLPEAKAHFLNQYELLLRVSDPQRLPYAARGQRLTPVDPEEESLLEAKVREAAKRNSRSPKRSK